VSKLKERKIQHIALCPDPANHSLKSNGFEQYKFEHCALPELDFDSIDTSVSFLGKTLSLPLIISSLTGGCTEGQEINRKLAKAAQRYKIGFAVGSQRAAIVDRSCQNTFNVRKFAPDILLFANLGAIQLNYGFAIDECQRAVDMIEADALILHLNPLQEIFQPEGNKNFSGLLKKIEKICSKLSSPVVVKEVGYGINSLVAEKLFQAGVSAVDVSGSGSVSWSNVETERNPNIQKRSADIFKDWGITTAQALKDVTLRCPNSAIIAGGGIKTGVDVAKAIAMGATLCSNASDFLKAAMMSEQEVDKLSESIEFELKAAMFCISAKNIAELRRKSLFVG